MAVAQAKVLAVAVLARTPENVRQMVLEKVWAKAEAKARTGVISLTEEEVVQEEVVIDDENPQEELVMPEEIVSEPIAPVEAVVAAEEDDCPQCHVIEMMAVMGMAHTSCQLVEDDEKRDACIAWSEALDPELIDSIGDVAEGIVEHAGIEGIDQYSKMLNTKMHDAVIGYVQKRLDVGEPVTDPELALYKALVVRRGV